MVKPAPWLVLALVIPSLLPGQEPTVLVLLPIELNNLHKTPPDSSLAPRIRALEAALGDRLQISCGYRIVRLDSAATADANRGAGYLYDHPDVSAGLGATHGAAWVIAPRLNRASGWASDIQANVVRVRDSALVSNRVVEIKGFELGPELATQLGLRGAVWMADQVSQIIELAQHPPGSRVRRCPPNAP